MTDLKMAMAWLETGRYLVKHDEMSYSVRVTDFAEETDELRKVLLDALRWVPVETRLPVDGIRVLVCMNRDVLPGVYYSPTKAWYFGMDNYPRDSVTHWMPLPAPPRRDE